MKTVIKSALVAALLVGSAAATMSSASAYDGYSDHRQSSWADHRDGYRDGRHDRDDRYNRWSWRRHRHDRYRHDGDRYDHTRDHGDRSGY